MYTKESAISACTYHFKGDTLAANVTVGKYLLKDKDGNYLENCPDDMHKRAATEFAIHESKYPNSLSYDTIYNDFKEMIVIPQGSVLYGIGNNHSITSVANCFAIAAPADSYSGIIKTDEELVNIMKRRGGVGLDLSTLRPRGAFVNNSARSSDGIPCFMERYSNTTKEVAQNGRRGALMLSLHCHHPDILNFIRAKKDRSKVNAANISVKWTDEFLDCVKEDKEFELRWPVACKPEDAKIVRIVKAREIWEEFIGTVWESAEPGCLFWGNMIKNSLSDCYPGYETLTTNPCLTGDTWVNTDLGPRQITDLEGQPFFANTTGSGGLSYEGFWKTGVKQVFKIVTDRGYSIRGTANHKFKLDRFNTWKQVSELRRGDMLSIDPNYNWTGMPVGPWDGEGNSELGWMMGSLIGDGCLTIKEGHLTALLEYWGQEAEYVSSKAVKMLKNNFKCRKDMKGGKKTKQDKIRLSSPALARYATSLGIGSEKTISAGIEKASYPFYCGFLRGLFDADGSVQGDNKKGASVRLSSSVMPNLEAVQRMLLRLNILSTIYANRREASWRMMPDGKGGEKSYWCQAQHELVISKNDINLYQKLIGFLSPAKSDALATIIFDRKRKPYKNRWAAKVLEIIPDGEEMVYDCTIRSEEHQFNANGFISHNCGEIALNAGGSCILILLNLTKFITNPFTDKAKFDYELFSEKIAHISHLADDLVDIEATKIVAIMTKINNDPEPAELKERELKMWQGILETLLNGRRVGIGITGLADCLAMLGIKYDSEKALNKVHNIFKFFHEGLMFMQTTLAHSRGAFPCWDWEKEKNCSYITQLPGDMQSRIQYNGRRNISFSTISPAGTVSMLTQTSSGVEPVFQLEYNRKRKLSAEELTAGVKPDIVDSEGIKWMNYSVRHHGLDQFLKINPGSKTSPYDKATAHDIDWKYKVKMQAVIQKYITHSISNTCNIPTSITKEEVSDLYLQAWESGCKGMTIYRDGSRDGVLTAKKEEQRRFPKRPEWLPCDIHYATIEGNQWVFFIGINNGQPYEIFGGRKSQIEIPKKYKTGWIRKSGMVEKRRAYDLYLGSQEDSPERIIVKDIADSFSSTAASYTRMLSTMLRENVPLKIMCEQLSKDIEASMFCFEKGVCRCLKTYIKDGEKASGSCESCGAISLQYRDGCAYCSQCGWSKCS